MENIIIQTDNLSKRYGLFSAVKELNLHVPEGSTTCFLGPNGAGKTTTIRMLLGLIRPSAGQVTLFGKPLTPPMQEPMRRIGSLVETPSFYPNLSGRENLELVQRLRQIDPARVTEALALVGLEKDSRRLLRHYSLGMCQRLGLAQALMGSPRLVILDEPTNGLDPAGIHEIRDLLRRLPEEHGITLFVSSHLLSEVEQIATRIGIIRQGRLLFEGSPAELRAAAKVSLTVAVDRPEQARSILRAAGWPAVHIQNHTLSIPTQDGEDAARINTRLVLGGFQVRELVRVQPTLEDIFLQVTQSHDRDLPVASEIPGELIR